MSVFPMPATDESTKLVVRPLNASDGLVMTVTAPTGSPLVLLTFEGGGHYMGITPACAEALSAILATYARQLREGARA